MSLTEDEYINSLIYLDPHPKHPTRYEMIRLSSWRVYFHQELQSFRINDISKLVTKNACDLFPQLFVNENRNFYDYLITTSTNQQHLQQLYRQDLISHFICRMLYSQDPKSQEELIVYQRMILELRLRKSIPKMSRLKKILQILVDAEHLDFALPEQQWANPSFRNMILQGTVIYDKQKISNKHLLSSYDFLKIPFQYAQQGVKRRRCFVSKGYVYVHTQVLIDIIISLYTDYLRSKLDKAKKNLAQLLQKDTQNQVGYFLIKSLDVMNQASQQEVEVQNTQKLTLKNVESYWNKFFPPCMMYLTEAIKAKGHLKHQGRRQLWLFFKGCGMTSLDNQQFFRRHMSQKVSDSQMKGHIYNIQHAYGQVGKREQENPKICRNIITANPPKRDQYHGCPFRHWETAQLAPYLKSHYKISEDNLNKIIKEKEQNRFQIACGNLFQSVQINNKLQKIPEQVSAKLGKSPHAYFQAGMEIAFRSQKLKQGTRDKNKSMDIQF